MEIQGKEIASDFWDKEILIGDINVSDNSFIRISVGTKGDIQKVSIRTFRIAKNGTSSPTRKGMTFFTSAVSDIKEALEYIDQHLSKP